MEARPAGGIGIQFETAPAVKNDPGPAIARFHWNFATKGKQAFCVTFQKDLKCLWHIGLEGPGRGGCLISQLQPTRGLIGRL
jgi:hypothetical protein